MARMASTFALEVIAQQPKRSPVVQGQFVLGAVAGQDEAGPVLVILAFFEKTQILFRRLRQYKTYSITTRVNFPENSCEHGKQIESPRALTVHREQPGNFGC